MFRKHSSLLSFEYEQTLNCSGVLTSGTTVALQRGRGVFRPVALQI